MRLCQIAVRNLRRRKSRTTLMVVSLILGVATMVSVHAVVEAMKAEMTRQLDELGANIIIKPDSGGLTFSYGGIVIPEVLFDVEKLTMADVASVREIPLSTMVRAVSPKLLGVLPHAGHHLIVSGSDLKSEFATKPWLRLHAERFADTVEKNETAGGGKDAEVTSLRQAVLGRDEMLSRLTRFGVSVSVLVLLVGMLVVVLTMSAAVRERTREIGIFRAIGFRQSHIVGIVLMEGAVLSLVGGIVGYLAGMSAARLAGPVLADMPLSTPWRADLLIAAVLVATATGLGASVFPARQAAGLDPAEALRFI